MTREELADLTFRWFQRSQPVTWIAIWCNLGAVALKLAYPGNAGWAAAQRTTERIMGLTMLVMVVLLLVALVARRR